MQNIQLNKITEPKGEFPEKQICEMLLKSCAEPSQNGGRKSSYSVYGAG